MSFSQHFSEAILPSDSPPASWHLARTAATGWLRHLPDSDASMRALAAALGLAPEVVRERLQATLRAYVADHWSDIEALGVSNFSTPRMQLLEAVRAGADPCATKQRRFPLVVHRVQEGIVAENFRVQARFRSLLHTARQLKNGAGDSPSSDPPSLLAAAQDALERGWRWGWSSFPPLRRCMPRLAPPVQLARAPSGPARRPRIVMLTGGMGAGKSTAIADFNPNPDPNPDPKTLTLTLTPTLTLTLILTRQVDRHRAPAAARELRGDRGGPVQGALPLLRAHEPPPLLGRAQEGGARPLDPGGGGSAATGGQAAARHRLR